MSEMPEEEIVDVLKLNMIGRLALSVNNIPYVVPICYSYMDDKLYFNLTAPGKKIDAIKENPKICFVVDEWEEDGSWRSVIVYGIAKLFQDPELSLKILENFVGTLTLSALIGMNEETLSDEMVSELDLFVCEVEIEMMTGRSSTALIE
jgi:nitroimidazol reductase NimA-like FMN-containing flavoprotein (pyridoxamine 5'-phosphate oxidase superfamily)